MEVDATMKLESNFTAKFWYSLDGDEFQPCKYTFMYFYACMYSYTYTHTHTHTYTCTYLSTLIINFKGSSQKKFSRLQAGLHCVIVQFIPTVSSLDTIEKTKEFTVPPKG